MTMRIEAPAGAARVRGPAARTTSPIFAPFACRSLEIMGPGTHPGGRRCWIEPAAPVMVAVAYEEEV
ncbi:MAG: hypothetical protein KDE35_05055 [Geminicoccaceae bacterium]|nr:hypothetical protein [Geminicoccaceae bacterium]